MKRFFASLFAAISGSSEPKTSIKVETADINSVRYSMPTVAADSLEYLLPGRKGFEGVPHFHEDEWAQLEFFQESRLSEIERMLKEFNSFERVHRTEFGWNKIYAREVSRTPIFPHEASLEELGTLLPGPVLFTSSMPLGQVKGGFSIKIGENAHLYGLADGKSVTLLAADLAGADDMLLTRAFTTLNKKYGLILVDWRQQFVLVSVTATGAINVWRP